VIIILSALGAPAVSMAAGGSCRNLFQESAFNGTILSKLKSTVIKLEEPLAISSYLETVGQRIVTDQKNNQIGYSFIFRPSQKNINSLKNERQGLKPYETEIDTHNHNLFTALGFKEGSDPIYGNFMKEVPDPQLFEYLRKSYNEKAPENMQINMGIYQSDVISAHQSEILRHWINDGTMALSRPEFGAISGKSALEIKETIMRNADEINSIYRHDLEHFASIMLVTKDVVNYNRQVAVFWQKALASVHQQSRAKELKHPEHLRDVLDSVYVFVRRFHSLTHVLGMLARENGAIDINTHTVENFGAVAKRETPNVHWTGLGFRPNWVSKATLPFESRLLQIGLAESRTVDKPVTIADTYNAVTNEAVQQIQQFIAAQTDPVTKAAYQQMAEDAGIFKLSKLSTEQLKDLHDLTLRRYREMGN
jgi:hypothetical protein